MQADQGEHEALEVLHQVVKSFEAFGVLRLLHVQVRADLSGAEEDLFVPQADVQVLLADLVGGRPVFVVLSAVTCSYSMMLLVSMMFLSSLMTTSVTNTA